MENVPQIDSKIIEEHGLSFAEYDKIVSLRFPAQIAFNISIAYF